MTLMTAAAPKPVVRGGQAARRSAAEEKRSAWWMHILLASMMLCAVAAANGRPPVFTDTAWYYSQGEYLAWRLGIELPDLGANRASDPTSVMPDSGAMRDRTPATVAGGRSPFYGLLLVLAFRLGTLWLLVAVQAFLSAWSVCVLMRGMLPTATPSLYQGVILTLSLGTSLPFFAAFAMPDIFAGLLIIAVTVLAFCPKRFSVPERALLRVLLVACLTFHTANVALAVGLSAIALATLAAVRTPLPVIAIRAGGFAMSVVSALALTWAFATVYRADAGVPQRVPPFLMARLLADGPGRDYLAAVCPNGASPTLCRFADRPFASEDEILWSEDRSKGIFSIADYETRNRLGNEEPAFVSAVIARDPVAVLAGVLRNGLRQFMTFYVLEPLKSPARFLHFAWWRQTSIMRIIPDMGACERAPETCEVRSNGLLVAMIHISVVMMAWIFIISATFKTKCFGLFPRARSRAADRVQLLAGPVILIVLGVILNAVICGAASGTFARYQARVIWLIPLLALLLAADLWQNKRARSQGPATS